jgi:hypothetical protein
MNSFKKCFFITITITAISMLQVDDGFAAESDNLDVTKIGYCNDFTPKENVIIGDSFRPIEPEEAARKIRDLPVDMMLVISLTRKGLAQNDVPEDLINHALSWLQTIKIPQDWVPYPVPLKSGRIK